MHVANCSSKTAQFACEHLNTIQHSEVAWIQGYIVRMTSKASNSVQHKSTFTLTGIAHIVMMLANFALGFLNFGLLSLKSVQVTIARLPFTHSSKEEIS